MEFSWIMPGAECWVNAAPTLKDQDDQSEKVFQEGIV